MQIEQGPVSANEAVSDAAIEIPTLDVLLKSSNPKRSGTWNAMLANVY